jgi:predicted DCC family thiol-disulfide oxidoreductase YuxK
MRSVVLYDEHCNFCKVIMDALLSWDGGRERLRPLPIQSAEGQRLLHVVPPGERLDSFHLVAPDGSVRSGGPALAALLHELPAGGAPAALLERLPGPTAAGYGWVARNRVAISRYVPGALKRRANRRLQRRLDGGAA